MGLKTTQSRRTLLQQAKTFQGHRDQIRPRSAELSRRHQTRLSAHLAAEL